MKSPEENLIDIGFREKLGAQDDRLLA